MLCAIDSEIVIEHLILYGHGYSYSYGRARARVWTGIFDFFWVCGALGHFCATVALPLTLTQTCSLSLCLSLGLELELEDRDRQLQMTKIRYRWSQTIEQLILIHTSKFVLLGS